jgi:hypothetical protein
VAVTLLEGETSDIELEVRCKDWKLKERFGARAAYAYGDTDGFGGFDWEEARTGGLGAVNVEGSCWEDPDIWDVLIKEGEDAEVAGCKDAVPSGGADSVRSSAGDIWWLLLVAKDEASFGLSLEKCKSASGGVRRCLRKTWAQNSRRKKMDIRFDHSIWDRILLLVSFFVFGQI